MEKGKLAAIMANAKLAVLEDESNAIVVVRVRAELLHGVTSAVTAQSSSPLSFEGPTGPKLGLGCSIKHEGALIGMVPVEMFLASMATCVASSIGVNADILKIDLDKVTIDVTGYLDLRGMLEIDPDAPLGFSHAKYSATILSDADMSVLQTLATTTDSKSPVLVTARKGVEIAATYILNGKSFIMPMDG
jgi:uncharacterized OsmC-like protein